MSEQTLVGKIFREKDDAPWTNHTMKVIKHRDGYVGYAVRPYWMWRLFGTINAPENLFLSENVEVTK